MRNKSLWLLLIGLVALSAYADNQAEKLHYYDALQFRMINKGFDDTETPYTRLPMCIYDSLRPIQKTDGQMSAGLGIRFRTNSTTVGVRYNLRTNFHMNHMADTGIKGTDLYVLDDEGKWHFVNCSRTNKDSIQNKVYVSNLDGAMREYLIYLPLYDGVNWMEIGVDSTAVIEQPKVNIPRADKRIVLYGSSILQGGCASRTGMVATNILQRNLGVECVNIGLSGEGKMDLFIAESMARVPHAAIYVVDAVPNCTFERIDTITGRFINILHQAHPEVPIVMIEHQGFAHEYLDSVQRAATARINSRFHEWYVHLKHDISNLYYINRDNLIGPRGEGTVDGAHLTDLGFDYYARKVEPVLRALLQGRDPDNINE